MLDHCDPIQEIGAALGVKERRRLLLTEQGPSEIWRRLADFYDQARLRLSQHDHYQRRILSHIVVTRPHRSAA